MKTSKTFLCLTSFLWLGGLLWAQPWTGIIASGRAIDWTSAGVTGGIPLRTTICASLSAGATAAQIQSALNSCASGGVVSLAAGKYTLNNGLTIPSNVTLRGAGGGQTMLTFTGSASYYWGSYLIGFVGNYTGGFEGSPPGPSGSMNCGGSVGPPSTYSGCTQFESWVGTNGASGVYTKGATVLNLSAAPSGLKVGDTLQLVQTNDTAPTTGPFVCQDVGCSREGDGSNATETAMRQNAAVVAISGSSVTISPGLYTDHWSTAKKPVAYWWSGATTMAGVENMTITSNVSGGTWTGALFYEASNCWFSGVALHVTNGTRTGFLIHMSRNSTIQNSWLDQMSGGGYASTTSYGIVPFGSTGSLIQNNILYNVESPIITQAGSAGDVYAYNYDPGVCTPTTGCTGIVAGHDGGGGMDLFEGNIGPQIRPDTFHGNEPFWTIFRNRLTGSEQNSTTESAIDLWSYSRYYNIVGNVLGTNGNSNNYECFNSAASGCDRYGANILRLGYPGANATTGSEANVSPDPQVQTTVLLWGNWDTVTNATRWCGNSTNAGWATTCGSISEVPTGLSSYSNPVPATTALPASLYLPSAPAWWATPWGTPPWPAIGPDVTGGNISGVGGHANAIPAQLCYQNTGSYLTFSASACYAQSSGTTTQLNPPTNLSATAR